MRSVVTLLLVISFGFTCAQREVHQAYRDSHCVILLNPQINRTRVTWAISLYSESWKHAQKHSGRFVGSDGGRLKGTFQATAGEGSMAGGVNPRNLDIYMDISPSSVRAGNLYDRADKKRPNQDVLFEFQVNGVSKIIEEANNGMEGSPAFGVWGTKGWTHIAIYDIFLHSGFEKDAEEWKRSKLNEPSDAATAKNIVYWFRDWWLPIYEAHGKTEVLSKFFQLQAKYWPKERNNRKKYLGTMNVAQFVHFFSGAAGTSLLGTAKVALGWEDEDDQSLAKAQQDFPQIQYEESLKVAFSNK